MGSLAAEDRRLTVAHAIAMGLTVHYGFYGWLSPFYNTGRSCACGPCAHGGVVTQDRAKVNCQPCRRVLARRDHENARLSAALAKADGEEG